MNTIIDDCNLIVIQISTFAHMERIYRIDPPLVGAVVQCDDDIYSYNESVIYRDSDGWMCWGSKVHGFTPGTSYARLITAVLGNLRFDLDERGDVRFEAIELSNRLGEDLQRIRCEI